MKVRKLVGLCLLMLGAVPAHASADSIIFNSFGPGDSFSTTRAYFFGYFFPSDDTPESVHWRAMPFVAQETATLQTVTLPIQRNEFAVPPGPGALQVVLYTDNNGLPGSVLESFTYAGSTGPRSVLSFDSLARPQLIAGATYFLAAQAAGYAEGEWWGSFEELGQWWTPFQGGPLSNPGPWGPGASQFRTAFRLTGEAPPSPTPEPGSVLLLLTGVAIILGRRALV